MLRSYIMIWRTQATYAGSESRLEPSTELKKVQSGFQCLYRKLIVVFPHDAVAVAPEARNFTRNARMGDEL